MAGFVKLYRSLLDWEWYTDVNTHRLFTHLLLTVNWKDGRWKSKTIKRGQRVTSIEKLSKETRLSIQQTRTALRNLQTTGEITSKSTNKYTLITVEKYEEYQGCDDVANKQTTNNQQTEQQTNNKPHNKQSTTIEERKNKESKNKELKDIYRGLPIELHEPLKDYADMRNKLKKPLTENAMQLALKKLETLSGGDLKTKIEILNQSTFNSWVGLFPIKETDRQKSSNPFKDIYLKELENEQNRSSLSNGNNQNILPRILPPDFGD